MLAIALAALAGWAGAGAQTSLEYQVKASYLHNFIQFVDWPSGMLARAPRFNLCVVGLVRFGQALEPLAAERVQGRPVAIVALERPQEARAARCHLLYVARGAPAAGLAPARGRLTVGETPGFLHAGGIINLVEVRGRIRFEVNVAAADEAGLTLDARLLRLALNVP
jgi:hypothetical protein